MVNAWLKHLLAFRTQHPNLSLKDAMKQAKLTYKPPKVEAKGAGKSRKMKGGLDASAVAEGIKQVASQGVDIGKAITNSIDRKRTWDDIVQLVGNLLKKKGFSGFWDPRIDSEWVNYIVGSGIRGGSIAGDIQSFAVTSETRRALSLLNKRMPIINKTYKWLARSLGLTLEDLFPGVDTSNLD